MKTEHFVQDHFLNHAIQENIAVAIYLINGIKLIGKLVSHNARSVFLKNINTQMVHKKTISTILPITDHILPILSSKSKKNKY